MRPRDATFPWPSTGQRAGVKGISELIQWINSALNVRSPGFIRVCRARTAASARRFLRDLERVYPLRIHTILAYSGKEFNDRLFGLRSVRQQAPTSSTSFAQPSKLSIA